MTKLRLLIGLGVLSTFSTAYSNSGSLGVYVGMGAVASFQHVDNVHSTTTFNPPGAIPEEINSFNIRKTTPGVSLSTGATLLKFASKRNLSVRGELEYKWYDNIQAKQMSVFAPPAANNYLNVDVQAQQAMFNLLLDNAIGTRTKFYFGGGVGAAFISTDTKYYLEPDLFSKSNNVTNFAWAGILGFNHKISNKVGLNLAYNYTNLGKVDSGTVNASPSTIPGFFVFTKFSSDNLVAHNVVLGLTFGL
ncbi:MAG: outer membrane beta-barrel protein [Gammaproteobacteria bacterium]|nr:outer membrane beta-barrel protein [Gammaproteobacteria bacterium]